jgi:hypothetical protein
MLQEHRPVVGCDQKVCELAELFLNVIAIGHPGAYLEAMGRALPAFLSKSPCKYFRRRRYFSRCPTVRGARSHWNIPPTNPPTVRTQLRLERANLGRAQSPARAHPQSATRAGGDRHQTTRRATAGGPGCVGARQRARCARPFDGEHLHSSTPLGGPFPGSPGRDRVSKPMS